MRLLLATLILFSTHSFAGLRTLGVKNLSLDYVSPYGKGTVDKIHVGIKSAPGAHELEVEKIDETFVVKTPMLDFTWLGPWKFLLDAEKLSVKEVTASAGKGKLEAAIREMKLDLKGPYSLKNGVVQCAGESELPDLENELLEICRESLKASADRFEIPLNFLPLDVLARLPQPQEEEPLKNFTLSVNHGKFYLYFLAQVVVKAGLRAWGNIHYEDGMKLLVIRVDLVKFGVIPVTSMVLKKLKEEIKDPRIDVKPPFIRVQLREE